MLSPERSLFNKVRTHFIKGMNLNCKATIHKSDSKVNHVSRSPPVILVPIVSEQWSRVPVKDVGGRIHRERTEYFRNSFCCNRKIQFLCLSIMAKPSGFLSFGKL